MGKIRIHRPVKLNPSMPIEFNYEMARIAEENIREYRHTHSKKLRRELFRQFYHARLSVFKALYKKYDFPAKEIKAIIDETFYWLIEDGYKPNNENSRFAGFIHLCFLHCCLTKLRSSLKEHRRKLIRLNGKGIYARNTCLPVGDLKYFMKKARLSKNEKQVLDSYFIKRFTYRMIAKKMEIAESTVRNTKRHALLKIKAINEKIYKTLRVRRTLSPILDAYLRPYRLRGVKAPDIFINEHTYRILQERRLRGLE